MQDPEAVLAAQAGHQRLKILIRKCPENGGAFVSLDRLAPIRGPAGLHERPGCRLAADAIGEIQRQTPDAGILVGERRGPVEVDEHRVRTPMLIDLRYQMQPGAQGGGRAREIQRVGLCEIFGVVRRLQQGVGPFGPVVRRLVGQERQLFGEAQRQEPERVQIPDDAAGFAGLDVGRRHCRLLRRKDGQAPTGEGRVGLDPVA